MLTVQAEGAEVLTVEGLAPGGELHALQEGFMQEHGLQCGFWTPGMLMRAYRLLEENPKPGVEEIRCWLACQPCRGPGYDNIVEAEQSTSRTLRRGGSRTRYPA